MTTGTYDKKSALQRRHPAGFGGWLAALWVFAALMVLWHFTTVIGDGSGLNRMFETPENAAVMRVVLWLKVWLWAPFLILAPLTHRLMPPVTIVMLLVSIFVETSAIIYLLDLSSRKIISISIFNGAIALIFCAYLAFSKRSRSIAVSARPVDMRARRHFALLVLVVGSVSLAIFGAGRETAVDRVSFLTAYLFLILLTFVLSIGPLRTLKTGRTAVNINMRRDVGIWTAVVAFAHLLAGLGESMTPVYIATYVDVVADEASVVLRQQLFTWGTIIGLVIAVFIMFPLALSNDGSLRRLGKRWWKRLHRASYVVFALTVLHALAFQYLENRVTWLIVLLLLTTVWVVALQLAAFVRVRVRRRRRRRRRA